MQELPFLDVHIQIRENELDLTVWQKTTDTGILLNFNAICLKACKSTLVLPYLTELSLFVNARIYLKSRSES